MNHAGPTSDSILRTLAPLLRALEAKLRTVLDETRRRPLDIIQRASIEGVVTDLQRKAGALDTEKPLLVVMLMGGTGVGKSTLLNALAGAPIAQAAVTRPTTRDPVVYFHDSVRPEQLDPALRYCKLQQHHRDELAQKILVDTPDLDSNDLANRETLIRLLPIADVVLYVGSQEKYHDQLGWQLFRDQRQRRAFAFVMNKWDRCLHPGAAGVRPDEDLLADLKREGFEAPLLFRTAAQRWLDSPNGKPPADLPAGEQFRELVAWLEAGLTRMEIEAVKARGVLQLLQQVDQELVAIAPPDLTRVAEVTRRSWDKLLRDEAAADAEVLLGTLDPYQAEIEHHFSVQGQARFTGPMRWYLKLYNGVQFAGSALRDRLPMLPRLPDKLDTKKTWNVAEFTRECSRAAGEKALDKRLVALSNRLLVDAEQAGFPIALLSKPCEDAARLDWRQRFDVALSAALQSAEQVWVKPSGPRKWIQWGLVTLSNVLPMAALLAAFLILLYRVYVNAYLPGAFDFFVPFLLTLVVLVALQVLIALLLPMRWATIRGEFHRQLEDRLRGTLREAYDDIPTDVASALLEERRRIEELRQEAARVIQWVNERQQRADIARLYGSESAVSRA